MISNLENWLLIGLGGWMLLASLVTFTAFGLDKRAAIKQRRRTPESRLHLLELMGGWPGAVLAALVFRHKIRKPGYLFVLILVIALWVTVIWYFATLGGSGKTS